MYIKLSQSTERRLSSVVAAISYIFLREMAVLVRLHALKYYRAPPHTHTHTHTHTNTHALRLTQCIFIIKTVTERICRCVCQTKGA